MKRRFILSLLWVLTAVLAVPSAWADTSNPWRLHLAYHEATRVVSTGNSIYALFNGNLLSYDPEDQSVTTIDKFTGLSDKGIARMQWSEKQQVLVIVYENNNIDLLSADGTVVNLPQVKDFTEESITIRNLCVSGEWATISTTRGVIVINIPRAEVKAYFKFGHSVSDAFVINNTVYAAIDRAIIKGKLTDNLYDFSQWKTAIDHTTAQQFLPTGEGAYLVVPVVSGLTDDTQGICFLTPSSTSAPDHLQRITPNIFTYGTYQKGHAQFLAGPFIMTMNPEKPLQEGTIYQSAVTYHDIAYGANGTYWLIDNQGKLRNCKFSEVDKSITDQGIEIGNFGPYRDLCYKMHYAGNRLLVAGGRFSYDGSGHYPPTAMAYEDGKWTKFQDEGFTLNNNAIYRNVMDIIQDPADASHHFVASSAGLLEFRDFQFVKHYNHSNSTLEIAPGAKGDVSYVMTDALAFDADGNLWMTNYEARNGLKVMKHDGNWTTVNTSKYTNDPTPENLLIDSRGLIWVGAKRTDSRFTSGLLGLNIHGTLDEADDDDEAFRTSMSNEDGKTCKIEYIHTLCEDLNGQIWLGCAAGVFAVTDPNAWFGTTATIYQPKVPRNDGTNYADYLLTDIEVRAIVVDGGNRKWIGTMGSGLYLVNPEGTEVLEHYTTANSPLLSDNIYSLAFNPTSGELMIGTNKGLCSYQTGIVPPAETLNKHNIKIFPNPVRPGFSGKVTITGLTEGAEVKIVSANSQLVARGTAIGGSFHWDVRSSASGKRVAPGVYYVFLSDADGSESVAGKMVVI